MIALDLAHSVVMPEMVPDIGAYLVAVAPSYVVMPIITTLTMDYLERRSPRTEILNANGCPSVQRRIATPEGLRHE